MYIYLFVSQTCVVKAVLSFQGCLNFGVAHNKYALIDHQDETYWNYTRYIEGIRLVKESFTCTLVIRNLDIFQRLHETNVC